MITLIVVGKLKEDYLRSRSDALVRRIRKRCPFEIVEVGDIPDRDVTRAVRFESEAILRRIRPTDHMILFDLAGKPADRFFRPSCDKEIVIVVGGSNGVDDTVRGRADEIVNLSAMTFPHQLVRLVVLEILNNRL